jgi:hypothetical protein
MGMGERDMGNGKIRMGEGNVGKGNTGMGEGGGVSCFISDWSCFLEHLIRTIIGTVFVHISYFPHARCVVSCVVSCVGHVLCCALLRRSTMF